MVVSVFALAGCPNGHLSPIVPPLVQGIDAAACNAALAYEPGLPCAAIVAIVNAVLTSFTAGPADVLADYPIVYRGAIVLTVHTTAAKAAEAQAKVDAFAKAGKASK